MNQEELLKLTKVELFDLAEKAGLNPTKSMRKARLVAVLLDGGSKTPEEAPVEAENVTEAEPEPAVEDEPEKAVEEAADEPEEDNSGTIEATKSIHADGTHSPYEEADPNGKYPPSVDWPDWEDGQDGYYKCPECSKWAKNPSRHKSCAYWGNVEDHNHVVKQSLPSEVKVKATTNLSDEDDVVDPVDEVEPQVKSNEGKEIVVNEVVNLIHERLVRQEDAAGVVHQSVVKELEFASHSYAVYLAEEFKDEEGQVLKRVVLAEIPINAMHWLLNQTSDSEDGFLQYGELSDDEEE
jgi:hypothetical protein